MIIKKNTLKMKIYTQKLSFYEAKNKIIIVKT